MTMLNSRAAVLYSLLWVQNHFVKRVCAETGMTKCVAVLLPPVDDEDTPFDEVEGGEDDELEDEDDERIVSCAIPRMFRPV